MPRSRGPHSSPNSDQQLSALLREQAASMTTRALTSMEQSLPWFAKLGAEQRSWITLVARSGIDGFGDWLDARTSGLDYDATTMFSAAPSALTGEVSLHQTVDLVRATIDAVEQVWSEVVPAELRLDTSVAILTYSREVAFAAAEIYARAAETRGAWDARLEALVVDSIVRAESAETVMSRASALGWSTPGRVCVLVGAAGDSPTATGTIRRRAARHGFDCLVATQGDRSIVVISKPDIPETDAVVSLANELADAFGPGHIVVGPIVSSLAEATNSARAALAGLRASVAASHQEQVVEAHELLPERALAGDGHARRALVQEIYRPILDAGGDLLPTCDAFLDNSQSVEGTARALFVHANTVRYRLKRVQELTGYSPHDGRDAFVLRLALTLGRLAHT